MKADLYTAEVRAAGVEGLAHRTAAGFVVLASSDGDDMIELIDAKQGETDLIDHVVAMAQTNGPAAFAMLFTAGGDLYLIASGNSAAEISSPSTQLSMSPMAGQVLVHPLSAGIGETMANVRLRVSDADRDAGLNIALQAGTIEATWLEVAVGGATIAAPTTTTGSLPAVSPDTAPEPPQGEPAPVPSEVAPLAPSETEPAAPAPVPDATELAPEAPAPVPDATELAPEAPDEASEVAPAAPPAPVLDATELAPEAPAPVPDATEPAPEAPDEASEVAPAAPPAAEGVTFAEEQPAADAAAASAVIDDAAPEVPLEPQEQMTQLEPAVPTVQAAEAPDVQEAPPAQQPIPAAEPAPTPTSTVGPVTVLGVACSQGHHNHPDAVYCSQCGTKMGVHHTTVLLNGPRPPLGVLVVDDGTTYSLSEDLVIGREPTSHEHVVAGAASPMILTDDTLSLSRKHARIVLDDWSVLIQDLNSSNGTFLSRAGQTESWVRLESGSMTALEPGDRLRVGGRIIQVELHHVR